MKVLLLLLIAVGADYVQPNSGVTAGTYGSNYQIGQFTVNNRGIITAATAGFTYLNRPTIVMNLTYAGAFVSITNGACIKWLGISTDNASMYNSTTGLATVRQAGFYFLHFNAHNGFGGSGYVGFVVNSTTTYDDAETGFNHLSPTGSVTLFLPVNATVAVCVSNPGQTTLGDVGNVGYSFVIMSMF